MPLGYYSGAAQGEAEWVVVDTACRLCGQNLRGLHVSQGCPGCGTPAGFSAAEPLLRFAHPGWLARVRSGLLITLWATIAGAVVFALVVAAATFLAVQAEAGAGTSSGDGGPFDDLMESKGFNAASSLVALVAGIVLGVGTFRITAAEPTPGRPEPRTDAVRRFARVAAVLAPAYTVVQFVLDQRGLTAETSRTVAVLDAAVALVQIAGLLAVMYVMAKLAARVPDRGLAFRARLSLWGVGTGAAIVVLLGLVMNMLLPNPEDADYTNRTLAANLMAAGCTMGLAGLTALGFFVLYVVALWQLAARVGEARAHAEQVWTDAVGSAP